MTNPSSLTAGMSTATIMWGIVWGSIGFAYFTYGRKQRRPVPLATGIAMCVFPYFVTNTLLIVGIGVILSAVPYFVRL
jgi:CHASE2 domain-containing sensor protein